MSDTGRTAAIVERVQRRAGGDVDPEEVALLAERARSFSRLATCDQLDYRQRALWERLAARAREQFEREIGVAYAAVAEGHTADPQARWPLTCRTRR
ncbi:MAG: hypothetical protein ABEH77_11170 [Halobacteriaceae archaeon]